MKHSVYFVSALGLGRVKIGKTQDLAVRLRGLQASNPDQLLLVGEVIGYTSVERWFHEKCAADRIHGEWFVAGETTIKMLEIVQRLGSLASEELCPAAVAKDHAIANPPKITPDFIQEVKGRYEHGETIGAIAGRFPGIDPMEIGRILQRRWPKPLSPIARVLSKESVVPLVLRRYRGETKLTTR